MKEIEIYGDYIQLDQFLKKENIISSGGGTVIFSAESIEKSSKFRISMRRAFPHLISSPQLFYRLLHQEKFHLQDGSFFFFPE